MATSFPGSLDTFTDPLAIDKLNSPAHHSQHEDANDSIESLEAKVGEDGSAVTTSHDYKLSEITGTDKAVGKTANQTLTSKTLTLPSLVNPVLSGIVNDWVSIGTGIYNSGNSFNVNGNFTGVYGMGDRVRLKQGGAYFYRYLNSTSYSAPNTLFTIQMADGVGLANAAITDLYLSKSPSPVGFPGYLNYMPGVTYSGGTTDPTSNTRNYAIYSQVGRLVTFNLKFTLVVGTGDRTTTNFGVYINRATSDYITFSSYTSYNSTPTYGTAYSDDDELIKLPVTMNQNGIAVVTGSYWI